MGKLTVAARVHWEMELVIMVRVYPVVMDCVIR